MKIYNTRIVLGVFIITAVAAYADKSDEKSASTSETVPKARKELQNVASEGGLLNVSVPIVYGREGYTNSPSKVPSNATTSKPDMAPSISTSSPILKSTVTDTIHKIAAKKGVGDDNVSKPSNATTQPPAKPKKPLVTVPGGNESMVTSNSPSDKSNSTTKMPKVPNSNILSSNVDNTQKYIVPIVIVILSVPFVAILISVVYKRGAEWWKYRHYRRMDFLINGMYDN
ncbi:hypothetical protein PPYR_12808 [Photinus pyralis]|uniref:Uncharacterized protein n=1 Tax=Photinus pyralis TaxID=7054 RepID=A0A1Y1LH89_PHOPY|nr:uncharacterized protein LOC116179254 [Photinus pyralis]KAB0793188.1 hypothetical protein PPYR_12808 [Photinus pyralis]